MTSTKLTSLLSAAVLALTLSACDSGDTTKKTETKITKKTETKTETKVSTTVKDDTKATTDTSKPVDKAPDPSAAKVQLAASIAKEISVAPEQADEILSKHGLDRDKFDAMIFEIAGDPNLTRAYMAARKTS